MFCNIVFSKGTAKGNILKVLLANEVGVPIEEHSLKGMWNFKKKMIQMNLYTKQKQTRRHRKQTCSYQRRGGVNRKVRINIYTHYCT